MVALTIGMATYDDFDGVYFTVQALRMQQDLADAEILVIDNFGCDHTEAFINSLPGTRYIRFLDVPGPAAARNLLFREAQGEWVLNCDSHVLFLPGSHRAAQAVPARQSGKPRYPAWPVAE